MLFLPNNQSLLTLNLSRKHLTDDNAKEIAEMLKKNKKLRRLELEGNLLGPDSAKYFAEALRVNKTLRYLDLENNNLTDKGEDDSGIKALFEALADNTMLISLNLANNYLTVGCGNEIISSLRKNKTLIHLEIFDNTRYEEWDKENPRHPMKGENDSKFVRGGLGINQISEIIKKVNENNVLYDEMRLAEWKERKNMKVEYEDTVKFTTVKSEKALEEEMKIKEKERIENFYLEHFSKHVEELENNFVSGVDEFFAENKARLEKKNKKRRPVKKKK
jgi:hypothetical protein